MDLPPGPPPAVPAPDGPPPPDGLSPGPAPPGLLGDEDRNRRLVATVAALALVAVAVMIGVLLLTGEDDPAAAPPPSTVATTAPPATESPVDDADVAALVDELQGVVAELRGREFRQDVALTVLEREAYEARVRDEFQRDVVNDPEAVERLRQAALAYQALGVWPPGADPVAILEELTATASLGFYDPETDEMVVAGVGDTPLLRITLAHELVHALEDQHFDLDRPALEDRDDEASFAFSAVVEGSASRVERAYAATLSEQDRAAATDEEQALVDGLDLSAFPGILLLEQQFVYDGGQAFIEAVHDDGGDAAVDRALRRPPTTTEQIQEPELWLAGEPAPRPLVAPPADGDVVAEGVTGQFLLDQLTSLGRPAGEPVAEWDGDRYVLWEDGDQACLRILIEGDAEAMVDQLGAWADQTDGEVRQEGDAALLERCG